MEYISIFSLFSLGLLISFRIKRFTHRMDHSFSKLKFNFALGSSYTVSVLSLVVGLLHYLNIYHSESYVVFMTTAVALAVVTAVSIFCWRFIELTSKIKK